jgi:hypothetical protein
VNNAIGYAKFYSRSHLAVIRRLRVRGKPNCRRLGSWDTARKKDCFAFSGGNRFVRRLLTASSVIAVMPACMLTLPNPSSRNEWPAHCEGGIHYVWPRNWGRSLSVLSFLLLRPTFCRNRPKRRNSITNFSFTTFPISFRGSTKCWSCLQPVTPGHTML